MHMNFNDSARSDSEGVNERGMAVVCDLAKGDYLIKEIGLPYNI